MRSWCSLLIFTALSIYALASQQRRAATSSLGPKTYRITLDAAAAPNSFFQHGHVRLVSNVHLTHLTTDEAAAMVEHPDVLAMDELPSSQKSGTRGTLSGKKRTFHAFVLPSSTPVDWTSRMSKLQSPPVIADVRDHKMVLQCEHSECDPDATLRWATSQPEVFWVEVQRVARTLNRWSKGISQSGQIYNTPIHDAGIMGEGQIVGVADTGIDFDNCLYWDHNQGQKPFVWDEVDLSHRKVVLYLTTFGDARDNKGGHGSHVTGSVAGNALTLTGDPASPKQYNGMAPMAKLAFTDIEPACQPGAKCTEGLNLPQSLDGGVDGGLFPLPYSAGARIHSNSWGSGWGGYDREAEEIDRFTTDHPDLTVLFAAGNDGEQGVYSIGSPATCKNCISVGAAQNSEEAFKIGQTGIALEVQRPESCGGKAEYHAVAAAFGPRITGTLHGGMVRANPADGCKPLVGDGSTSGGSTSKYQGKVVLIDRGTCAFVQKAQNAQDAGAIGYVVADNKEKEQPFSMGGEGGDGITIRGVMVSKHVGAQLMYAPCADAAGAADPASIWEPMSAANALGHWAGNSYHANGDPYQCDRIIIGSTPTPSDNEGSFSMMENGDSMQCLQGFPAKDPLGVSGIFSTTPTSYDLDIKITTNATSGEPLPYPIMCLGKARVTKSTAGDRALEIAMVSPECASNAWCTARHTRPTTFSGGPDVTYLKLHSITGCDDDDTGLQGEWGDDYTCQKAILEDPNYCTEYLSPPKYCPWSCGTCNTTLPVMAGVLDRTNASFVFDDGPSRFNQTNMAGFSSRGPTYDGRLKPDISAPGMMIFSTNSDGKAYTHECSITPLLGAANSSIRTMSGTSMATPTTAGLSALVRQYYVDGWYPSGAPVSTDGFNPSAAVVKATIITSGQDQNGTVDLTGNGDFFRIPKPPSFYQGYGRIELDKVLRISSSDPKGLYVANSGTAGDDVALAEGANFDVCLTVPAQGSFKASLAWTDLPGNTAHMWRALVNDLDLVVTDETGNIQYGNEGLYGDTGYGDAINNAEQVVYSNSHTSRSKSVQVTVNAAQLVNKTVTQAFGLVIHGDFVSTAGKCSARRAGSTDFCPKASNGLPCGGASQGSCNGPVCECLPGFQGSAACAPSCPGNCSYPLGTCVTTTDDQGAETTLQRCMCTMGRFGADCAMGPCQGEVVLDAATGSFATSNMPPKADASGSQLDMAYPPFRDCTWKITTPNAGDKVFLNIESFSSEMQYDELKIYDGPSASSPQLATFSGVPGVDLPPVIPPVVSTGNTMFVKFNTDQTDEKPEVAKGFKASFKSTACPAACSGHGTCAASGNCTCEESWFGDDCNSLNTGGCTLSTCSGHGTCNSDHGCDCENGFKGPTCSTPVICNGLQSFNDTYGPVGNNYYQDVDFTGECDTLIAPALYSAEKASIQTLYLAASELVLPTAQDSITLYDDDGLTVLFNTSGPLNFKANSSASPPVDKIYFTSSTGQFGINLNIASGQPWSFKGIYFLFCSDTNALCTESSTGPTYSPTTNAPTTHAPTLTPGPTTHAPTTHAPTTLAPTAPTTLAPTAHTTLAPTPTTVITSNPTPSPTHTGATSAPTSAGTKPATPGPTNPAAGVIATLKSSIRLESSQWMSSDVFDANNGVHTAFVNQFEHDIASFFTSKGYTMTCQVLTLAKGSIIVDFNLETAGGLSTLQDAFSAFRNAVGNKELVDLASLVVDSSSVQCLTPEKCPKMGHCPAPVPVPQEAQPAADKDCDSVKEAQLKGEEEGAFGTFVGLLVVMGCGCSIMAFYCMTKHPKETTGFEETGGLADQDAAGYAKPTETEMRPI